MGAKDVSMETHRSPIFRNGRSEMSLSADRASEAAIFAYALGDLLRDAEDKDNAEDREARLLFARRGQRKRPESGPSAPSTPRMPLPGKPPGGELDFVTWSTLWRRGGDKTLVGNSADTQMKAWERWKNKVEALGIGRRTGTGQFEIDKTSALRWVEETIQRGVELAKAYQQATGRELEVLRPPSGETERGLSVEASVGLSKSRRTPSTSGSSPASRTSA